MTNADCLFCKFVNGDLTPDVVHETTTTLAFRDIHPQAPVHVLVVPKVHQPTAADLASKEPQAWVDLMEAAAAVAELEGIAESGYRMILNTGADALQSVFHLHLHVLGGRPMGWPPG